MALLVNEMDGVNLEILHGGSDPPSSSHEHRFNSIFLLANRVSETELLA